MGKPLPASIQTARPLFRPPRHYDHKGEAEWINSGNQETDYSDEDEEVDAFDVDDDLFLNGTETSRKRD